jgi:hypothetical protein
MQTFTSMFPQFLSQCLNLKSVLTPVAFVLLTAGLIATVISHHESPSHFIRAFGKTIGLIILLVYLPHWGNQVVTVVDDTVKNTLNSDPSKIYDQYQAALQVKKTTDGQKSWWQKIMDWRSAPIEWVVSGVFMLLGWLASAIMWWAYILQSAILFMGYALAPIFVGFMAFPSLYEIGRRYCLHLVGVMLWPLGWALAGLITQGVITFMTDRSFLVANPVLGNDEYSLQNLMGLAFLGIWIIFSTIAAPVALQKAIQNGSSAAADLLRGAFSAGAAATGAGAMALGASGTGGTGIKNALQAGAVGAASFGETLALVSLNNGGNAALVGTLVGMQARNARSSGQQHSEPVQFAPNDPTGSKSVSQLLAKDRNPNSR